MKKYVNGKVYEMTKEDFEKIKSRFGRRAKSQSETSGKVSEDAAAALQTGLNETKNE